MLEIQKVFSRYTIFYSYKKVYFVFDGYNMCYKKYHDYFLKKKISSWCKEVITYRGDIDREYKKYVSFNVNSNVKTKFHKEYKKYKYRIRKDKIKRLIDES